MATVTAARLATLCPRVLVVDDEPALIDLIGDVVAPRIKCRVIGARTLSEARKILKSQPIELLVADINLPDGDGMSLLAALHEQQPSASAIVITGSPSVDRAICALRQGALDFVPKPFSVEQLTDRVQKALVRQSQLRRNQHRLVRLRDALKRLNEARRIVTRKVDLLCNDLITAYGELSRQFDAVRTQEGFRHYLAQAQDLEQLLCHTMDWILRQLGYANVAIWMAADEDQFQLGAYMKYTMPGDSGLINSMREGLLPLTIRDGVLRLDPQQASESLTPAELRYLKGQSILGVNCTYLGEPLAAVILFRPADKPFTDEDAATMKMISPVFSCALASAVRGQQDQDAQSLEEDEPDRDEKDHKSKNEADWWKRGEQPPF